jgi:DNA invertase Pin-like site-specific DNA recombinase
MSKKPTRVALYARVSTHNGQNVELQLEELRQVARQRGWDVVGEFIDDGVSGAKEERPGLDAMMKAASLGKLDSVAVWKLDRLGRSLQHLLQLLNALQGYNVDFLSLRDAGIDTTSASGRLMLHLIGAFCEYERSLIQERVIAGVRRAQASGTHCGRPVVDMDLRPALAMFDQGHGLKATARALKVSRATLRRRLIEADEWPRHRVSKSPRAKDRL